MIPYSRGNNFRRYLDSAKSKFRIELTPEQKAQVRSATGKDAEAVELSVEELEERIAPRKREFTK